MTNYAEAIKLVKNLRRGAGVHKPRRAIRAEATRVLGITFDELIQQLTDFVGTEHVELRYALNLDGLDLVETAVRRELLAGEIGKSTRTLIHREDKSIDLFVKRLGYEDTSTLGETSPVSRRDLSLSELGERIATLSTQLDELAVRRHHLSDQLSVYLAEMSSRHAD